MKESKDKEYELLRKEISEWQSRRLALIGVSVTVVTALLGLSKASELKLTWDFISLLLLLFLTVTCWLTAYCGIANLKIGTYLQSFHEGHTSSFNWEGRNCEFSQVGPKFGNLNQHLGAIYLVLAVLSLLAPPLMFTSAQGDQFPALFVLLMFGLFVTSLVRLYRSQDRRNDFLEGWAKVKEQEARRDRRSITRRPTGRAKAARR